MRAKRRKMHMTMRAVIGLELEYNWFRICIWLIEKVTPVFQANGREQKNKQTVTGFYYLVFITCL